MQLLRHLILIIFLSGLASNALSQISSLSGAVKDENGAVLGYVSVVLLNPADSTLAFYGVTNDQGFFEIKGIKNGKYLLQATLIGHTTVIRQITLPAGEGNNPGTIILKSKPVALGEVVVSEEHVPLQFKRDTVEFNTAAFVTKPDAVVEDLLKKLPGMEVDRAGNIKAMGEDVKKVLVDGREFFGSDPKLATRNVPADAIKKVQVYDKKSDESEFTGIDDGTRDKTLNLLLKDNRKNAVLGELLAGSGNDGFYQGSGKVYRFTKKDQLAALGMINNINQFGFSFKDYIDFNGGLQNLGGHGGAVQIRINSGGGSSFPVNFGQPVTGLSTSGAAGFNFSRVFKKDSRIFMSYIANGSDRDLNQTTMSRNYTQSESFQQTDTLKERKNDRTQRLNFGLRDRIDSTQNLIINGSASLSTGKSFNNSSSNLFNDDTGQNRLSSISNEKANWYTGNISGSYLKLINRGSLVFRLASDASFSHDNGKRNWMTDSYLDDPSNSLINNQFQNNVTQLSDFSASSSLTVRLRNHFYIEPELKAGSQAETIKRIQGIPSDINTGIDSLSPGFKRQYNWFRPELRLKRNTEKTQFTLGLQGEIGRTGNSLNNDNLITKNHLFFIPNLSWEYEYKMGRRLRAYYETIVNVPDINQLLPVTNIENPLILTSGNRNLKPELGHNLSLNWWIFDQFSFTSLISDLSATYTHDKINWNRTVKENLSQQMSLVNVPDDYRIKSSVAFSTPVRSLGIKVNANIEESWNRGLNFINELRNINSNFNHKLSLSIENRKKTRFDIIAGGAIERTDASFSIQKSLNDSYLDFSYFTELRYNPGKHLNFQFTAEVSNYSSRSFQRSLVIPLMGAEVSYYFLKNNRGTFTLQGFDLLNRNTGIERSSEFNYLREQRSNMMGRFFMLSFKYKLNKFGDNSGGVDVKINKR
jgi:hypothetical protein